MLHASSENDRSKSGNEFANLNSKKEDFLRKNRFTLIVSFANPVSFEPVFLAVFPSSNHRFLCETGWPGTGSAMRRPSIWFIDKNDVVGTMKNGFVNRRISKIRSVQLKLIIRFLITSTKLSKNWALNWKKRSRKHEEQQRAIKIRDGINRRNQKTTRLTTRSFIDELIEYEEENGSRKCGWRLQLESC